MAAFSKMQVWSSKHAASVVAGAGSVTLLLASSTRHLFVSTALRAVPRTSLERVSVLGSESSTATAAFTNSTSASSLIVAGTMGLAAAGSRRNRERIRRSPRASSECLAVSAARAENPEAKSLNCLTNLAADVILRPDQVAATTVQQVRLLASKLLHHVQRHHLHGKDALTKVLEPVDVALHDNTSGQLRWVASSITVMLLTFAVTLQPAGALDQVTYSDFLEQVQCGNVEIVRVQPDMMSAQYQSKDGSHHEVNLVPNPSVQDALLNTLAEEKVEVRVHKHKVSNGGPLDFLAHNAGRLEWLIVGLLVLFGGIGGTGAVPGMGGRNLFQLRKSPAKIFKDGDTKVKFPDVAGCDGAKGELVEVVDFLKNTARYTEVGAKIPKGALLVGPPGTGKTLLAKAVAGEAGVPFFSVAASEFVEIFAGMGAARVRDLFAQAKISAPCIIFIDEIDAVGRQRSAGFGQQNDEREQTVNQLLTEMDGFNANNGVVVLAATNRADILDNALMRPGRFDRRIQVDPPDVEGRTAILKVHAKKKCLAPDVDLTAVARQTPGMSGADLANLLNEGAIVAARKNAAVMDQDDIATALERLSIGLEKKDAVMSEKKRRLVAYHEAGHAILGALMNDFDVVSKISIVPRGPAGGVTIFMPSEERLNSGLYSKEFLENRMCVALGGRLAEEIINGKDNVTTGASNDFQQCTQVAEAMVKQLGMSDVVGQRVIGKGAGRQGPFMAGDFMAAGATPISRTPVSQSLRQKIDAEVRRMVDAQYERGFKLLSSNRCLLDNLAQKLLDRERVSGRELREMVNAIAAQGKLTHAATACADAMESTNMSSRRDA